MIATLETPAQNKSDDNVDSDHDGDKAKNEQEYPFPDPDEPAIESLQRTGNRYEQAIKRGRAIQFTHEGVLYSSGQRQIGNEDEAL